MQPTKIAILGAGYAGVHAAKALWKEFRKNPAVKVTIYDKNPYHTLMTELHEVAGGRCEPESVRIPLAKIFGSRRVDVVVETIETIDFEKKHLIGRRGVHEYDYLILGPGAEPEFFNIPGAQEHSLTLWSYEDAVRIRARIQDRFLEASRESDPAARERLLTFTVAGGGFTGIEMLGELLEWRPVLCQEYGIPEDAVKILLVEAMTEILPTLPKKLREKSVRFIQKKGGILHLNAPISEVKADGFQLRDRQFISCGTLIWTCGVKGSSFAGNLNFSHGIASSKPPTSEEDSNLRYNIKKKGRLASHATMQSIDYENVFIVGDVLWLTEKGRTLPQIVETALQTGECAAHNIAVEVKRQQAGASLLGHEKKILRAKYHGILVSIGGKYAVANIMGILLSGFLAMTMKHLVNLHYLWEIGGVNLCWAYLQHHIFSVAHGRSVLGSQASAKTPTYWLLPLRLFLGVSWVFESLKKIFEGWLDGAQDKVAWMFTPPLDAASAANVEPSAIAPTDPGVPAPDMYEEASAALSAPDMIAAATPAPPAAAANPFDLSQPILSQPFFVYQWFMDTFVAWIPHPVLQIGIVLMELAIGLALMGGLFTFLAALASVGLCLMFAMSGAFRWDQLWFVFGALALCGGAGRSAGLDAWVLPWLQKWWNGTRFSQRTYLYFGQPGRLRGKRTKA